MVAAAALAGCATARPGFIGGADMDLPPDLASRARIAGVQVSSPLADVTPQTIEAFTADIRRDVDQCAEGSHRLDLHVRLDDLTAGDPVEDGALYSITATAEFSDPSADGAAVGRYPVTVRLVYEATESGTDAERRASTLESWGDILCWQVFGRP